MGTFSRIDGIKWVFFDLDDTLWAFSRNSNISLDILYRSTPLLQKGFPCYDDFSDLYHRVNATLWDRYHHGEITQDFLKTERFRRLFIKNEYVTLGEASEEICRALNSRYLNILSEQTNLVEGAIEILQILSNNYLIGILTNGFNDVQYKKIYGTELNRYVQRMIVSDEIGIQKPDLRIFRYAQAETGAKPDECVMIGDNPATDIAGAKAAGWKTIYFNPSGENPNNAISDIEIKHLSDLKNLL